MLVVQTELLMRQEARLDIRRWPPPRRPRRGLPIAVWLGLALTILAEGGCLRGYRASQLPPELIAPSTSNLEAVDLSRLSPCAFDSQLVERGDVLDVTMMTDFNRLMTATTPVRVGDDGMATIPLIGPVPLLGLELVDAEQAVRAAAIERGLFRNPQVTLTMRQKRTSRITVAGAVNKPGVYELPANSASLVAVLVAAGGLSLEASPDVEVRRPAADGDGGPRVPGPGLPQAGPVKSVSYQPPLSTGPPQVIRVNLMQATVEGDSGARLRDGDMVFVAKQAPKPVYVLGLVKKPGEYKMPLNQDLYVLDALALAGGTETSVADRVIVLRRLPDRDEPALIRVSIAEAKSSGNANLRLAPGDIVSVEHTPQTVVVESIKTMLRFGFSATIF